MCGQDRKRTYCCLDCATCVSNHRQVAQTAAENVTSYGFSQEFDSKYLRLLKKNKKFQGWRRISCYKFFKF